MQKLHYVEYILQLFLRARFTNVDQISDQHWTSRSCATIGRRRNVVA